ncbi:MAG: hypothetical protein AABX11_07220 [Nanoarchaeota archaeon]
MDKIALLNGGFRRELASYIPVLGRLETYAGLNDLKITGADANKDRPEVIYEASASPKIHRRLKSALVEAGVITQNTPTTQTFNVFGIKHMRMYFFKDNLEVELKVTRR